MEFSSEISYRQLLDDCNRSALTFNTTNDLEGCKGLIGQEKAEEAMMFGLRIKRRGYNIYISGDSGSGRLSYAKSLLKGVSRGEPTPGDICCVYNFASGFEPSIIMFDRPGCGRSFMQDMDRIIDEVTEGIPEIFSGEEYERNKNGILDEYHRIKDSLIGELNSKSEPYGIMVKGISSGIAFTPMKDNKPMSDSEYDGLGKQERERIIRNISEVKDITMEILRRLNGAEREARERTLELDSRVGAYALENLFSELSKKYREHKRVSEYLAAVKQDILKNLDVFAGGINTHSMSKEEEGFLLRYRVNLLVDNSETGGAPVIFETNPTYGNLIGSVEFESKQGTISTDFLKIRPGAMLKANGGYLILEAEDVLKNYQSWDVLKRVLKTGELRIESMRNQLEFLSISTLKPDVVPLSMKVVLIGSRQLYHALFEMDAEFSEYFKIRVDFRAEMERSNENVYRVAQFIGSHCAGSDVRHLESDAVRELIRYSSRMSGSRTKLSARMRDMIDIVDESDVWAAADGNSHIGREHVKKAIHERTERINGIEQEMLDMYRERKYIIDVHRRCVGQVNGLSVVEIGGFAFGRPCRITASSYIGRSGIIDIEREANMSGNLHSKGVMIISGYIGETYAKDIPLSLAGHICFEQMYSHIDGDSASIAELYAVLSSISGIPLKQGIAVTGSLNQKGEVQPVGGINEKIEGFYKVCSLYGLDGKQGVIIPRGNVKDIVLDDDVMSDIRSGQFHIYAIKSADEGMEILTDMSAGSRRDDGSYPEGTFNSGIDTKLNEFAKKYRDFETAKNPFGR